MHSATEDDPRYKLVELILNKLIVYFDFWQEEDSRMICLIPEFCYMTGLTDEMRSDFRVMKDLAMYTKLTPTARQACLRKFIRNVNGK